MSPHQRSGSDLAPDPRGAAAEDTGRLIVVVNPAAGKGRALRELPRLRERLGRLRPEAEIFLTQGPGFAARLLEGLALRPGTRVVVVGGDGSVHEVGTALFGHEGVEVGVIPLGSGNDIATQLGVPRDPLAALDAVLCSPARPWDLGVLGPHPFLNTVGFGLSADTCYWSHRTGPLTGLARYGLAVARAWWTHRPLRIGLDGLRRSGDRILTLLEIGVGDRSGGGFRLTGRADPADGLLDVCAVEALARWQIPWLAPRALRGTHTDHPSVVYEQLPGLRLRVDSDTPIHVDGEMRELPAGEHSVRVRSKVLRLVDCRVAEAAGPDDETGGGV